jgi:hypothetical protein
MKRIELLRGAYDIHVHCGPDVVPRSEDLVELAQSARQAGMGGIVLKDHTTSTDGRVYSLNKLYPEGPRFFSSLALNPPVGQLNPVAVEAALRAGVSIIYFPTYASQHHFSVWGAGKPPTPFPLPSGETKGVYILEPDGNLCPECKAILLLIAEYDAVLATGHLSPRESLELLEAAAAYGIARKVVTHASLAVSDLSMAEQMQAASLGAKIEHCFFAATESCPNPLPLADIATQIRQVGTEHVILSSDFGQVANGAIVAGFAEYLHRLMDLGFSEAEIRIMIVDNPRELLNEGENQC